MDNNEKNTKPGENKEEAIADYKAQLKRLKEELDELKKASGHLSTEAKKHFDVGAAELEKLYQETNEKFDELKGKAESSYKEAKAFVELTNKALRHSFNYFMSHYRKK